MDVSSRFPFFLTFLEFPCLRISLSGFPFSTCSSRISLYLDFLSRFSPFHNVPSLNFLFQNTFSRFSSSRFAISGLTLLTSSSRASLYRDSLSRDSSSRNSLFRNSIFQGSCSRNYFSGNSMSYDSFTSYSLSPDFLSLTFPFLFNSSLVISFPAHSSWFPFI